MESSEEILEDPDVDPEVPLIEELYEGSVPDEAWEDYYNKNKKEVDHFIQEGEAKYPKGHFPEYCDLCKKSFVISQKQLFCPRCGYPIIRENEDGTLSHER